MSNQHRALNALIQSVSDRVERAFRALRSAQNELETIRHLIVPENWWHEEHVKRPTMYSYGPIEGTKKDLARWIFPELKDARCLETANRTPGIIWVVKLPASRPKGRFHAWFTSNSMFRDAQTRKLVELKAQK